MKLSISSLDKSPKLNGKHETLIINQLIKFFRNKGYQVQNHVSLNIAWGSLLSEIDLILQNNNEITIIEVKSKKDNINSAHKQIETYKKYADYVFIASNDMLFKYNFDKDIGLIYVDNGINIMRNASRINYLIDYDDLKILKNKCLVKFLDNSISNKKHTKKDLLELIKCKLQNFELNTKFKKVLFCNKECGSCEI